MSHLQASQAFIDPLEDHPTMDGARTSFLTSIFLFETNRRSAAWSWLGSSVRICQSLGLHVDDGPWPASEAKWRRWVWWSVYVWDRYVHIGRVRPSFAERFRLLAIEMGLPLQIDDDDCIIELPDIPESVMDFSGHPSFTHRSLLLHPEFIRCLGQIAEAVKSFHMDDEVLKASDAQHEVCMAALQPLLQTHPTQSLDPQSLMGFIHLQNARLVLHRRKLAPICSQEARISAVDSCVAIARDTVEFLSRIISDQPLGVHPESSMGIWVDRIPVGSSSMLCTHLWRCNLFLCLGGYFSEAQVCVRASAAVGNLRPVNSACGKHITFFLGCLVEKMQRGGRGVSLDTDEEMLAYVSGDLQGDFQNAWIWQDKGYGKDRSPTARHTMDTPNSDEERRGTTDPFIVSPRTSSPHLENQQWAGWDHVLWLLERLSMEHVLNASQGRPSVPPATTTTMGPPQPTASASGRISIADII